MTNYFAVTKNYLLKIMTIVFYSTFILSSLNFGTILGNSEGLVNNPDCIATEISNFTDVFDTTKFFPLVPAECALDENGKAAPLSLESLPILLVRGYGAITSLVLYLGVILFIYGGFQYMISGGDAGMRRKAILQFQTVGVSIVMVLLAYVIVNTIVIIFGLGKYADMNVADFFVN